MKLRFVADDFTGASDVLLQCRKNGMEAAIVADLLHADSPSGFDGIASTARSMTPGQLSDYLPGVLSQVTQVDTDIFLYKVCSTFDSSPHIGSIGHAVALLREHLPTPVPITVVPAQPGFGRFTAFGHHFAVSGEETYRLDRHPVMSNHPTTPMNESDLRLILVDQGVEADRIAHVSITELRSPASALAQLLANNDHIDVVVVDAIEETDLDLIAGALIASQHSSGQLVPVIGSGGIAGALARANTHGSTLPPRAFPQAAVLALSGSRSPVTQRQIRAALDAGWAEISLDKQAVIGDDPHALPDPTAIVSLLEAGQSVVVSIAEDSPQDMEISPADLARASGRLFAHLIRTSLEQVPDCRIAVLGGDTSSWTVSHLNPHRIQVAAEFVQAGPILTLDAPGIPETTPFLLKGGQVGDPHTLCHFATI